MTKRETVLAALDFTMDEFESEGRCENVNYSVKEHYRDFLEVRPDIATQLVEMTFGNVLFELLPELVAAGATFDTNEVLDRLADCKIDENFIDTLNNVGISTDSIAEHYNGDDWKLFLEKGLSPEWLTCDSESANSALMYVANWGSKRGFIRELLKKCSPELRKELLSRYLDARTTIREGAWEWNDFFSLRPLIEAGVSKEEVLQIIRDYGHCDVSDLFRFKDDYQALELGIDPKDYFLEYFNTCWERFGDESPEYIDRFCDDYAVDLDSVVCSIPREWYYEMSEAFYGSGFTYFLIRIRESAGVKKKLQEYLFPNGLPKIDPDSLDCTDDEWLYILTEETV